MSNTPVVYNPTFRASGRKKKIVVRDVLLDKYSGIPGDISNRKIMGWDFSHPVSVEVIPLDWSPVASWYDKMPVAIHDPERSVRIQHRVSEM